MKHLFMTSAFLSLLTHSFSQANTKLSNLVAPTAVNQTLLPNSTNTKDLGSSSFAWKNLYLRGDIYLDATRFVSNAPGTTAFNAFLGSNSGNAITTGTYNTGIGHNAMFKTTSGANNTALGANTFYNNTSGSYNTAIGRAALYYNTTGTSNTGIGARALNTNTTGGYNVALGFESLYTNSTGGFNVGIGYQSLYLNETSYNSAVGYYTLRSNTTGSYNSAFGNFTLNGNTTGTGNTGLGTNALYYVSTASYNTGVGYGAGDFTFNSVNSTFLGAATSAADGVTNATAVGYGANVTASNQIMLGNTSVTSVKAAGSFVIYSDGRFKTQVKGDVPGLAFINALKPVTYHYKIHDLNTFLNPASKAGQNRSGNASQKDPAVSMAEEQSITAKEQKLYTGFVAQDVEAAAKSLNYDFSGLYKPANNKDVYGLSYADFVVPLVKAVQELNQKVMDENQELQERLAKLEETVSRLEKAQSITTITGMGKLGQNTPNPAKSATRISYNIPEGAQHAQLLILDAAGRTVKTLSLAASGTTTSVDATALSSGVYTYSLVVDGKTLQTRKMTVVK